MKLKLFIDKNTNKVLYAEAGKDFVDFLLQTFMKPFGLSMKQDFEGAVTGGLANLYTSVVDNLSVDYLQSGATTKAAFLNPNLTRTFYTNKNCRSCPGLVSDVSFSTCKNCCRHVNTEEAVFDTRANSNYTEIGKGYVKGQVAYMITDDLVVQPLSTSLIMSLLSQLRIKDIACVQESEVTLDSAKGTELVKAALTSKTVLTDILLPLQKAK